MYYCEECDFVFEEPTKYAEDRTPGAAFEGGAFIEYFQGCPICGGGYVEYDEEDDDNGSRIKNNN